MTHLLLAIIYLAFISLGLPDSLLGSVWPVMYTEFNVPVSYAGIISMIIAAGTIISSLQSDRLTRRLAPLYVGGASVGPYIMSYALTGGLGWAMGYRYIAVLQIILTAILLFSLPLWKGQTAILKAGETVNGEADQLLSLREIVKIEGAKEVMIAFFCYCALEQTTGLWASSYLVLWKGIDTQTAAGYASLFFIGITAGRAVSGFLTIKLNDNAMIRLGQAIVALGTVLMLIPAGSSIAMAGLIIIGLGCAPIYPCIIHSTPEHFGADKSQALIGVQMASAYVGTCLMPPVFGLIANYISVSLLPVFLLIILTLMIVMYEKLICMKRKHN